MESQDPLGPKIAPLVSVQDRKIKKEAFEIEAFGKGQFKARNSSPPLYSPTIRWSREMVELALLEEMTEIEEDEWHNLTSPDDNIRRKTGADILTRGQVLQLRNERLTEAMRWAAFQDNLTVTYADDGQFYKLTYGIPSTHFPTSAVDWSDRINSTPVSDIRGWQKMLMKATGQYGLMVHMNSDTYEDFEFSKEVHDKLVPYGRTLFLATADDITRLLYADTQIVIHDGGYRPEGQEDDRSFIAHNQWLPYGKVLITTPYTLDAENIADVPDGRVATTTNGGPPLVWNQGFQTETMYDLKAKTHFFRAASARIVRINKPRAFVWATVSHTEPGVTTQ